MGRAFDGIGSKAPDDKNHQRQDDVYSKILEVLPGQALQVNQRFHVRCSSMWV